MSDVQALLADLGVTSLAELRGGLEALAAAVSRPVPLHSVEPSELVLPDRRIALRTYRPAPGLRPVLMWFHGGGYVSGSLDAIDPTCRQLAQRAGVDVVSIDYRLAPEHVYPAGLEDCLAAVAQLRPDAVGGDSAGGGLAAAVGQRTPGLRAQLLLCPWLDATLSLPSVRANSTADDLNENALRTYAQLYTANPADPGASPLNASDLGHAPPAIVVTAGLDPLRDDGERYVDRLRAAGVHVDARRWEDQPHGFPGMTAVSAAAEESLEWAAEQLRSILQLGS